MNPTNAPRSPVKIEIRGNEFKKDPVFGLYEGIPTVLFKRIRYSPTNNAK